MLDTTPVLPPTYYLDNFQRLIDHAQQWYSDLLTPQEREWMTRFVALPSPSRCALVRMFSRKGHWFRSDKLNYQEIEDFDLQLVRLTEQGFIRSSFANKSSASHQSSSNHPSNFCHQETHPRLTCIELASELLTKPEVIQTFPELSSHRSARKDVLLEKLSDDPFTDFEQLPFVCVELLQPDLIDLLLVLFFGNTHQDLSQFVLSDLGLNIFEPVSISLESRFFQNRAQVDELLALHEVQQHYYQLTSKSSSQLSALLESMPKESEHPTLVRRRSRLINLIARDLERLEEYELALHYFRQSHLPPSRERQARIHDKLNQVETMSDVVTDIIQHPLDIAELEVAQKLEQRVQRLQGHKVPRAKKPSCVNEHLELDLSTVRVEEAVRLNRQEQGWDCYFSENTFLNGLFGLAFWDVIFAEVECAFINQYQYRPLDLYHDDFVSKRANLIAQVLDALEQQGARILLDTFDAKQGVANPFVQWGYFSKELLLQAIDHIPTSLLIELFRVLLKDLKLYRTGMPDLIAFNDDGFQWIEVKGPGDKLQDNQWRWIKEFERLEIPFSVCWVNH
ncbi:VRR-NUC domain-containing protein [Vibrio sp. D404a]|uniref:VRR-NUC domain-containing protein n=1 Tax=unclassified Vibrio TaxID=2614977 RepID=UPI0025532F29|nr:MULTISPECIES: VRR-NUC domain-containing protein [unclassified Vibrio]MDK9737398.1 VRR-NUC domain-containing protein [Vibrio sp. D404a]MDK9797926.1 VRR-NUC domain-containing protein [Vibrio sp. D449a]